MYKEFAAAILMTGIIVFFAVQLGGFSEDQSIAVPRFLLLLMGLINCGQYIQAIIRYRKNLDTRLTLKGFPIKRVSILCLLTLIYVMLLESLGFYLSSFIYFIVTSLIAQPMKITAVGIARRSFVSFICMGILYLIFTVGLAVQIPQGILKI